MSVTYFLAARLNEHEAEWGADEKYIAAARQILLLHPEGWSDTGDIDTDTEICIRCREPWPCETVRIIGSVYSSHPDYHEEWKP